MTALAALRRSATLRPLAAPLFGALWAAVLLSNIGNWMETVGAQWLLVRQQAAPALIALVQTADTLPVVLLALPAGVLADVFDRRRLLLGTQLFLAVVEVTLFAVTVSGHMTPGLLLALTFFGGAGAGVSVPAWQALIPDVVDRAELRAAAVLSSINVNLARAVGPAIAGLLIAALGVAPVFALNAGTFLLFAGVLLWARVPRDEAPLRRERLLPALRAGTAYVRWAPIVRTILLRAGLFLLPAMATWALLPLVASDVLGLDAAGYGVLLGSLGSGALLGVVVLGRLGEPYSDEALLRVASVAYAATMAVLVLLPYGPAAVASLLVAGACWVAVLSRVNAALQLFLPGWVRARGLAIYIMVLFGSQAAGAAGWGIVASQVGLTATFLAAAGAMVLGGLGALRWPLRDVSRLDRRPAAYWAEPQLAFEPDLDIGPVLVRVDYQVTPENVTAFVTAMEVVERSRRRTGARSWRLYREGADPSQFVELFEVASWEEHLRQHGGRLTESDAAFEAQAEALASNASVTRHYFPVDAVPEEAPADRGPDLPDER
jgi:MFS family permease